MNRKKVNHIKAKGGFNVPRRRGRKRPLNTRIPMTAHQAPNQSWSLGWASGASVDIEIDIERLDRLAVFDDFTRDCLCFIADTSLTEARVVRELDLLIARRGRPLSIVSDNSTKLVSFELQHWAQVNGIELRYHSPYKPIPKSHVERHTGGVGTLH